MHARLTYATLLLILILPLIGCGEKEQTALRRDDLGREIALKTPALRVITLAPSLTEIVFAAGGGNRLIGAGRPDDYPPAVDTLPRFSTYPVDFEAVAALEPDLVLATDQVNSPRDAATLKALGIPTYFLTFKSLEDVFDGIETVGKLLGTEEAAVRRADSLRRDVAGVQSVMRQVSDRPSVLFLIGHETLFSFGSESYVQEMIESAGGYSITSELESAAPVLSDEFVLTRRPDVIIGSWGDDVELAELLEHHPTWSNVPAVRNRRVYGMDASLVNRPGPRVVSGIREMASLLHPSHFPSRAP